MASNLDIQEILALSPNDVANLNLREIPALEFAVNQELTRVEHEIVERELEIEQLQHEVEREVLGSNAYKNESQRKNALYFQLNKHPKYTQVKEELRGYKERRSYLLNQLSLYKTHLKVLGLLNWSR